MQLHCGPHQIGNTSCKAGAAAPHIPHLVLMGWAEAQISDCNADSMFRPAQKVGRLSSPYSAAPMVVTMRTRGTNLLPGKSLQELSSHAANESASIHGSDALAHSPEDI